MLLAPKGTQPYRYLGRIFAVLMLFTAVLTHFMPARVGPTLFGHFGFLHLLSLLVIYCVPAAIIAIRRGDRAAHVSNMLGVYCGAILIAGSVALMPGWLLNGWLLGG